MNEAKTRLCQVRTETFDFLGYTIGQGYSRRTGRPYIGVATVGEEDRGMTEKIHEQTDRTGTCARNRRWWEAEPAATRVGELLLLGAVTKAYRVDRRYAATGCASGCGKHKVREAGAGHESPDSTCTSAGVACNLGAAGTTVPWAKA